MLSSQIDFEIFCKNSSFRKASLSWYNFSKNSNILDIGNNSCCASQLRNKGHNVYTELDVSCKEEYFDYILIFDLPNALNNDNRISLYTEYIKKFKTLLKKDGKLLIATNNRLGLRYFCGDVETPDGIPFSGINKYINGEKRNAFSRNEILEIISDCHFENYKFYYPLPDYQFTQFIFTDSYLPKKNILERIAPYHLNHNSIIADEWSMYYDIIDNGVFPFFSNSYIIECCNTKPSDILHAVISADRIPEHCFVTSIHDDDIVLKNPIYPEGIMAVNTIQLNDMRLRENGINIIYQTIEHGKLKMPYCKSEKLSDYLRTAVKKDKNEFVEILSRLWQVIISSSSHVTPEENTFLTPENAQLDWGVILAESSIELIPLNCFYVDNDFLFFDQEFVFDNYPAKYTMYRAVKYIYMMAPETNQYIDFNVICNRFGLVDLWDIFEKAEADFQRYIHSPDTFKPFFDMVQYNPERMKKNAQIIASEQYHLPFIPDDKLLKTRNIQLDLLREFDRVCKENNLTYYIMHGTLLGAVRHRGYIPWDDDIDVFMRYEEFMLLKDLLSNAFNKPYFLKTPNNNTDNYTGILRLINLETTRIDAINIGHKGDFGIWIDIFSLYKYPADNNDFQSKLIIMDRYQQLLRSKVYPELLTYKTSFSESLLLNESLNYTYDELLKQFDESSELYEKDCYYFVHKVWFEPYLCFYKEDFESIIYLDFEGMKLPAPIGYHRVLKAIYGDKYIEYPPVSDQIPHHFSILNPDVPYTEYQKLFTNMLENADDKDVIIFGAGIMVEDYLNKYGEKHTPLFLVDNDSKKWGTEKSGIEIKSPDVLLNYPKSKLHIIICSIYYREIEEQLNNMGIYEYKIYPKEKAVILEREKKGRIFKNRERV